MAGRKHKCLDKAQPVRVQPPSNDLGTGAFAELTKVSRVDNLFLEAPVLYDSTFEQSPLNQVLHLLGANMKSLGQRIPREPILTHACIRAQPPKHGANRSRRAAQQEGHFMQGMRDDQVEQLLLLLVGPFPIRLLL